MPNQELLNCLSEAQTVASVASGKGRREIDEAIKNGKFVVSTSNPYFCRSTDAFAGVIVSLHSAWDTREKADLACEKLYDDYQGDIDARVLPVLPIVPIAPIQDTEECPF